MNINKKRILAAVTSIVMMMSFSACGGKKETVVEDTLGDELRMSDYRGGVLRTAILQAKITDVIDEMKTNNVILRQDSPYDFWTTKGYQEFVSTILDTPLLDYTEWFTEEEGAWNDVVPLIQAAVGEDRRIIRNEEDDYMITGLPVSYDIITNGVPRRYSGEADVRILYNSDKDWCKTYALMYVDENIPRVTAELYEYQRITDDIFAIQTSKERIIVVLTPVEQGTDLRDRTVKEFYYSRLVIEGERTTYHPFVPYQDSYLDEEGRIQVIDEKRQTNNLYARNFFVNEQGDLNIRYGVNDSMFLKSTDQINPYWVFEDKALQQGIVYKDGILIVTSYNKLSGEYERFIYTKADANTDNLQKLEDLVVIKDLVGVQPVEVKSTVVAPVLEQSVEEERQRQEQARLEAEAAAAAEAAAQETANDTQPAAEDTQPETEAPETEASADDAAQEEAESEE